MRRAAIDDGGPRREFFNLLTQEIFRTSRLFSGWPECVVPLHDVHAVANNKIYVVGKMLATQGEPPVCFTKAIADYIVFDNISSPPCIDDIPDFEIKQLLLKVHLVLRKGKYTLYMTTLVPSIMKPCIF